MDVRNNRDNDSNDWREAVTCAEISNDDLAFTVKMNFNILVFNIL